VSDTKSTIMVGVDGSASSRTALRWALHQAWEHDAQVVAVTVWESPYSSLGGPLYPVDTDAIAAQAARSLDDAVASVLAEMAPDERSDTVERRVLEGVAAPTLCEVAAEQADLLVVGSRGHGGFTGLLLGSVSAHCAHHTPVPLVIVPPVTSGRLSGS
jgi:nucleotide-binding universal stress UspA family protein